LSGKVLPPRGVEEPYQKSWHVASEK